VQPEGTLRVYTDGSCRFCRWARGLVEPYDTNRRLEFRDYNEPGVAAETPYTPAELARAMHVRTPDGRWTEGYWAWIEMLKVLPSRRRLAQMAELPPARWLGPLVYKGVAANRYRIPRWFLRRVNVPVPCGEACSLDGSQR